MSISRTAGAAIGAAATGATTDLAPCAVRAGPAASCRDSSPCRQFATINDTHNVAIKDTATSANIRRPADPAFFNKEMAAGPLMRRNPLRSAMSATGSPVYVRIWTAAWILNDKVICDRPVSRRTRSGFLDRALIICNLRGMPAQGPLTSYPGGDQTLKRQLLAPPAMDSDGGAGHMRAPAIEASN
jgi:hypothetical protein